MLVEGYSNHAGSVPGFSFTNITLSDDLLQLLKSLCIIQTVIRLFNFKVIHF
ncbi:Uncharacterised protein [Salmonella enterica subsp. enterica]|nr:Uncharacterised protein [Salmonella enterica subsp. enterica]